MILNLVFQVDPIFPAMEYVRFRDRDAIVHPRQRNAQLVAPIDVVV